MSIGFSGIYLLGVEEIQGDLLNFDHRFDIKNASECKYWRCYWT
jgi:hypothetical protein